MTNALFNPDAEIAVLNIIFSNPDALYSIPALRPFMFSSPANTLVYSTILELQEQGCKPDLSVVASKLDAEHKLREAGSIEYLQYIKTFDSNLENLKEYERQIIAGYKAKSLISLSVDSQSKLKDGASPDEIADIIRKQLDSLDETAGGEQTVDFANASRMMWEELQRRVQNPGIRGITTGFADLDGVTGGYNPGDLWIVGARPSMGKSTDMCNSALSVALQSRPVLIFSLEMNKVQLAERMLASYTEIPLSDIRLGTVNQAQLDKLSLAIRTLRDLPIYIDTNAHTDEAYFSTTVRQYRSKKGIEVAFLDYVQLATERGEGQTADLGIFSRSGKLLANELGMTIVMYSQLNRGVELRDDKHPILSDLRQSGNLEEDADIVMFLYRDEYYTKEASKFKGILEKVIAKHRNGPIGSFFYKFDPFTLKIKET